ncbi:haloacid dehalogenase-like hydrolase [Acinetobacter bereziniae]|uniref:haloacid dehalogenase-like hydrolase n=1 Tax=Acinetobacter bereziniae TaxID=106648 RepID=UPI00124F7FAB|nr:haloacid dehalogenase-like hydrolase [Acinetobacter bereziniae]MBJ9903665.1 hypothetical protein [Acinetobacter bereziniae]MCU4320151.1 hypothetical protein [Acinetobacter bereziniae]MCU4601363.1 hypothetical protein [Acinetobacter bereziniae]
MKEVIFDVCWTMYKSNTTFDFIRFIYRINGIHSFKLNFLNSKIGKMILLLIGKLIGRDIYRELFISLLKGYQRTDLEIFSKKFYHNFLLEKKIDYTFEIFNEIESDKILLCSASLDIVVEKIASELKVKFFASELEYENGVCTGKISKDLLGMKDALFENKVIDLVVTDNLSDLGLVIKSLNSVILSTSKNVSFWERNGFSVDYILQD